MTRYGFAIKALPKGGKPFGDQQDDENEEPAGGDIAPFDTAAGPGVSDTEPTDDPAGNLPEDPMADPSTKEDPAAPPGTDGPPADDGTGEDPAAPAAPADDSRPWAGDEYNEGDESSPDQAYAAYTGGNGEQAWLDQDTDGTLTGWVRDSSGQVWRYTDADAWATDVDGAQMTRTHGPEGEAAAGGPADGGQPPADRGVQDSMFTGQ